jgi:hypothetical protein
MSALDVSDPSRSTNAAFAVGRLIERDRGKEILISDCGQYKIVSSINLFIPVEYFLLIKSSMHYYLCLKLMKKKV